MGKRIVYWFLVLSLFSLVFTLVPASLGQTENVKIGNFTYYIDNAGYLDVVGQVQNVGSNTVDPVVMTGIIYGSDGSTLGNSYCYVWVKDLCSTTGCTFLHGVSAASKLKWLGNHPASVMLLSTLCRQMRPAVIYTPTLQSQVAQVQLALLETLMVHML